MRADAVLVAGSDEFVRERRRRIAALEGPIVPVIARQDAAEGYCYDVGRLLVERVVTINTTASGGNAELLAASG